MWSAAAGPPVPVARRRREIQHVSDEGIYLRRFQCGPKRRHHAAGNSLHNRLPDRIRLAPVSPNVVREIRGRRHHLAARRPSTRTVGAVAG